ncbi:hypothetical protein [Streptomyces sp. 8L]|uniref:hypothetical protein n=1 Tax=Streptomyces sp. 8L TaxID=2877242 RepID=UPI001CD573B3|nr:hypothetical protein [Streptomyces sp. 8L]MCA1217784.1 hypothetical protein [Streptomyces sp. 8L]
MGTPTDEAYSEELSYLAAYAHDDWLGFSVLVGSVGTLLGKGHTAREQTRLLPRIVGDLLARGAAAGDLTDDLDQPFEAWGTGTVETVSRIAGAIDGLGRLPESGDVCWFTVPNPPPRP